VSRGISVLGSKETMLPGWNILSRAILNLVCGDLNWISRDKYYDCIYAAMWGIVWDPATASVVVSGILCQKLLAMQIVERGHKV
jgi:hypothetical protein